MSHWARFVNEQFNGPLGSVIRSHIAEERKAYSVFPSPQAVLRAFESTPYESLKVVIVGQDPYHTPGIADGLAFSSAKPRYIPPSLLNIFYEVQRNCFPDTSHRVPFEQLFPLGRLDYWASQGVFLYNTALTVREGRPGSHADIWGEFTIRVMSELREHPSNLVFMLWGKHAEAFAGHVNNGRHLILTASHPSPLSVSKTFHGCGHFKAANDHLKEINKAAIDWNVVPHNDQIMLTIYKKSWAGVQGKLFTS
jgi:uracil-DNA glycosylase